MSRRRLMQLLGGGATTGYLLWRSRSLISPSKIDFSKDITSISPIDRSVGDVDGFSGDSPHRAHERLWKQPVGVGPTALRRPASGKFEKTRVVVVGGGMAGLVSTWQLRKYKPVLLEQADRFGGNARGESWHGIDYSIGAAYFSKPDPEENHAIFELYQELGVDRICRLRGKADPVRIGGRVVQNFWDGESAPEAADQFRAVARHFVDIFESRNGRRFPHIPMQSNEDAEVVKKLDHLSFQKYVEGIVAEPLHPHISTALQHYCWSAFALPWNELGAAAGLNFYASEFGPTYVAPGGNGAIAELLIRRLSDSLPMKNLRTRSLVIDVSVQPDGVDVVYVDGQGHEKQITADVVIMACPKFVVSRLMGDLEAERVKAIKRLRYHSYLVANVLLAREPKERFYNLYLLGRGHIDRGISTEDAANRQGATDAVLANFSSGQGRGKSVVTLYRGFPYEGARSILYQEESFQRFKDDFLRQIREDILASVNVSEDSVQSIRIARWGHPLPAAERGLIADGVTSTLRKPFKERVFFAEQDNWMLPSMESSVSEALTWSEVIRKKLS